MPDGGEIKAVLKGIQEPLAQTVEDAANQAARLGDETMEKATASLDTVANAEGATLDSIHGLRNGLSGEDLGGEGGSGSPGSSEGGRSELSKMLNGEGDQTAADAAGETKYSPEFLKLLKDWREGRKFNEENAHRFPHNEVHLKSRKIVDSYVPRKEIVERKNTQLSEIDEKTAKGYIDSLRRKYKAGQEIGDTPKNRAEGIAGSKLRGKHILEVPKQVQPVPKAILEHAKQHRVTIRDVHGTVYELPKEAG